MARIKYGTLVANVVTTVVLDAHFSVVEVVSRDGAAEIFMTSDGSDPTIAADDTDFVPAAIASATIGASGATTTIKLRSSGTPKYCVRGVN